MQKFRLFLEIVRTCVPIAILVLQIFILKGMSLWWKKC